MDKNSSADRPALGEKQPRSVDLGGLQTLNLISLEALGPSVKAEVKSTDGLKDGTRFQGSESQTDGQKGLLTLPLVLCSPCHCCSLPLGLRRSSMLMMLIVSSFSSFFFHPFRFLFFPFCFHTFFFLLWLVMEEKIGNKHILIHSVGAADASLFTAPTLTLHCQHSGTPSHCPGHLRSPTPVPLSMYRWLQTGLMEYPRNLGAGQ